MNNLPQLPFTVKSSIEDSGVDQIIFTNYINDTEVRGIVITMIGSFVQIFNIEALSNQIKKGIYNVQ